MKISKKRTKLSTPHFYLKDKKSIKKTPIFLSYKFGTESNQKLKYSIKESVLASTWDFSKERPKLLLSHPENKILNERLNEILTFVKQIENSNQNLLSEDFKNKLDFCLGFNTNDQDSTLYPGFLTFMEHFIDSEKNKVDATITWKKYLTIFNQLKGFCADFGISELNYNDIDLEFSSKFQNWLYSPPRNQSQNSVSKSIEVIKKFMNLTSKMRYTDNEGIIHPYHTNFAYKEKEFNVTRVNTSKHPLLYDELKHLFDYDLENNPRLDRVRDLFLVAAFTGLRFSDFIRLSHQNIFEKDGNHFIRMFTKKGNTIKADNEVIIPCLPQVISIFKKYDFNLPTNISSQKMNKYLKELGELTNLDRQVAHKSSVGGKITETHIPIYTTITNHSARYSFITIMLNDFLISPVELQKITGQSLKVLMGYEKGNKTKNAENVLDIIMRKIKH